MMESPEKPILFHYPGSIYSYRVLWYLWLRGIPYNECIQSHIMPRPDLASIGINYRRIPIMAIGKDIYIDSRLIISTLESSYPDSSLAPKTPAEEGIRRLLESWTIDGGIFSRAVQLMPYWNAASALQDEKFLDDREKLSGRRLEVKQMEHNRPDALQHMRQAFDLLETSFLADGRTWILGGTEPSLADLDAVWPFSWLIVEPGMRGALPEDLISEGKYPRTFAWISRFMNEAMMKRKSLERPETLNGEAMRDRILSATTTCETGFIKNDPLDLQPEDEVEVFASDYGHGHKDRGAVVGLTSREVVIRNTKGLHLHFPRWNFRINKVSQSAPSVSLKSPKTPKMRLIYHPASPFTRKVYMLAHELGLTQHIELQKVVVCPVDIPGWSDNNKDVAAYNPMAKIPCLVSEEVPDGIFDSRMICEYLSNIARIKETKDKSYWQRRSLHACADGIMDAAVLITYELRIRKPRGLKFDEWIEGQKTKIVRVLDRFEIAAQEGVLKKLTDQKRATADEVAVVTAIAVTESILTKSQGAEGDPPPATAAMYSMTRTKLNWRDGRPGLVEWMGSWQGRKSFVATPPDKDWTVAETRNASKI
ncbi:unnamed protein product [Periconia digitata]|uniref:GST N-terminal domain-containing protein n=1 Tax=Periconia digitata TaxID=1303443 RepID=A0A9W4UI07_9PLEO|nr:unnamed protein product [Periconia digitata]